MPPMPSGDIVPYIFPNTRLPLAMQFAGWVEESPGFRVFAETYRDKIRKKVRIITGAEGYRDLQAELATANFLVLERRFLVEYEKYGVGKQRGPDFSARRPFLLRFSGYPTPTAASGDGLAVGTRWTLTMAGGPIVTEVSARDSRLLIAASLLREASIASTANSSPASLAITSESRNVISSALAARFNARSPSAWP